jgi:hypothetical protein
MIALKAPALVLLARAAGYCGLAMIVVLSLVPGDERPHTGLPGGFEHALAYGLTALALAIGHPATPRRLLIPLGLAFLAAALEVLQFAVPGRMADAIDVIASGGGALTGFALESALWASVTSAKRRVIPLPDDFPRRSS